MTPRAEDIRTALDAIASMSRALMAARRSPFDGQLLGRTQMDALFLLARSGALSAGAIAKALRITPGAVSQLLAGLHELGLVVSTPHESDARSRMITLSLEAKRTVEAFEAEAAQRATPLFEELSDDEVRQLAQLVRRLAVAA